MAFDASVETITVMSKKLFQHIGLIEDTDAWLLVCKNWINDILSTPMPTSLSRMPTTISPSAPTRPNFALRDITPDKRLNELEFHFPVKVNDAFLTKLQSQGYLDTSSQLSMLEVSGMMTGFIDLIVEYEGQYYLIDYKSNDLGEAQTSYESESLSHAMVHHQYDLQYLIYSVALNRYLTQSLADYDYQRDFGGICYLFLRGMSGNTGDGIYFDKPEAQLIKDLDALLTPEVREQS